MVGAHHAVAGVNGGAFHDGQNVALHPFARHVGPVAALAAGDLVNLVEEDDAGILHPLNGHAGDLVHINQALLLFLDEVVKGLANLHLPLFGALAEDVGQHVLNVNVHLFHALVRDDFEGRKGLLADIELDHAVVEAALAQLLAQLLAGAGAGFGQARSLNDNAGTAAVTSAGTAWSGGGQQQVEQALLGVEFSLIRNIFQLLLPNHVNGDLDQVTDHGFDVPSNVAHFGEFGSLHLQEGRVGQLGQAAGNLGFAYAGGTDHDDVLGNNFFGKIGGQLLAAHTIAQGNGHSALGGRLADHVLVELAHDLARR